MVRCEMRGLLANATEFLTSTLVDLMTKPVTIEADRIWAILSKVPTSVSPATGMCLSIMGKTNQERAKSQVRQNCSMYTNAKMTIAVKKHFVQ